MPSRGFEHVEHTADLGIRAWGESIEEAFAEAANGLFTHIIDLPRVEPRVPSKIDVDATDLAHLLYRFLEELRFVSEIEGVVFARYDLKIVATPEGVRATGEAWGEPYDAERHGHYHEVKAITLHDLIVQPAPPEVRVILDI